MTGFEIWEVFAEGGDLLGLYLGDKVHRVFL
ncbi:MAG: hypothetical protein ACJATG_001326 [Dinoroseobacter sp.]